MFSKVLLPLLAIASFSYALPLDGVGSPTLENRAVGGQVQGTSKASTIASGGTSHFPKAYEMYTGDGSTWPSQDKWEPDFEAMFKNLKPLMQTGCANLVQDPSKQNTAQDISDIHDGILDASKASGVDTRFILSVVVQESKGCVRVGSTFSGQVHNPGLMQSHSGSSCADGNCDTTKIHKMISDGAAGTPAGDGLAQCINQASTAGAKGAQAFYQAARIYNTGSYKQGSDLGVCQYGTACYSSDIANWLTGWDGKNSLCTLKP